MTLTCRLATLLLVVTAGGACSGNREDEVLPQALMPAPLETGRGPAGDRDTLTDAVSIIVEPGDDGSALIAALGAAKKSIHLTMYLLTDKPIEDALIARHKAGVEVKVVLNKEFPFGSATDNHPAYTRLKKAGVLVVWAPATFPYTHEKCAVLDGETAWIMTMNAATSSLTKNREYLAIDTNAADVSEAEAQFAADFAGMPYTPSGPLLMSPVTSRPRILELINRATATLDFEDEELSDPQVATTLCDAAGRGVKTRGVLSAGTPSGAELTAILQLKSCGVTMVSLSSPYIHAKAIVADGARVYVGSENLTAESLDRNRELGLIVTAPSAVTAVATRVAADIAAGRPLSLTE